MKLLTILITLLTLASCNTEKPVIEPKANCMVRIFNRGDVNYASTVSHLMPIYVDSATIALTKVQDTIVYQERVIILERINLEQ